MSARSISSSTNFIFPPCQLCTTGCCFDSSENSLLLAIRSKSLGSRNPLAAELIYRIGSAIFQRCTAGVDYCLIFLNCTPQDTLSREDQTSIVAIGSLENALKEINTYNQLMQRLKNDGFAIHLINNSGITKDGFFGEIELTLR